MVNTWLITFATKEFYDSACILRSTALANGIHNVLIYTPEDIKDFIEIDEDTGITKVKPLSDIPDGMTSIIAGIEENRTITKGKRTEDQDFIYKRY